jgi:hypothetical protein
MMMIARVIVLGCGVVALVVKPHWATAGAVSGLIMLI